MLRHETGEALAAALALTACASGPKPPDWQLEAKGAMERSVAAYLNGDARVDIPAEQLVLRFAIACGCGDGDAIARAVSQAKPIVVSLHARVAVAGRAAIAGLNERKQSTRGVAGDDIGIDSPYCAVLSRPMVHETPAIAIKSPS